MNKIKEIREIYKKVIKLKTQNNLFHNNLQNFRILEQTANIDSSNRSPIFLSSSLNNFRFLSVASLNLVCFLLLSLRLLLLTSDSFDISGNEQINHKVPFLIKRNLSSESLDFSCQHPENHSDSLWYSVVAWNNDIHEVQWSISVAQSNCWDVHV